MSDSETALDQRLVEQLASGNALSHTQLETLSQAAKSPRLSPQLSEIFRSKTDLFLRSIAASIDKPETSQNPQFVAEIARLITPDFSESVTKICEKQLKASETPSEFFLTLYSVFCVKQGPDVSSMVPTFLPFLALADEATRELATFSLIALIKSGSKAESETTKYLQNLLRNAPELSEKDFTVLSKALETLFPISPEVMTKIYVSESCKQAFLYQGLLLNPEKDTRDYSTAERLLQVLSSSCIAETARKFNTEHYLPLLIAGTNLEIATIRALSLLCIVKLWNFSTIEKQISMDTVFSKTLSLFISANSDSSECKSVLEALAYLSLGAATKSAIRSSEQAIEQFSMILETSKDPSDVYGCLSVLSNLTIVKTADSDKDTATLNYLKSMDKSKSDPEKEEDILTFNHALVSEHKLVGTMAALKSVNENSVVLIVQIIHSLTTKQDIAAQRNIVAQGGLNVLLKYLIDHSKVAKNSATTAISDDERINDTRLVCLRSLATLCRSVNPAVAFSKYDVKTCVPFLVELLGPGREEVSPFMGTRLGPADRLCSLLALTNLSSMEDDGLLSMIIRRTFDQHLKNLMIDSSVFAVQKATWELINNLVANPLMLAKFFNPESTESCRNLDLLVKMLHSQNEDLQVVIAGLMANATMEFGVVCESIFSQKAIFENLLKTVASVFAEQTKNDDLILRIAMFLYNLVSVASESEKSVLATLRSDPQLKAGIKAVVVSTKSSEIMGLLRDIIQMAGMKF